MKANTGSTSSPPRPIRAIGYARVSTGRQGREGLSPEAQVQAIQAHCTARGWHLLDIVPETKSGASMKKRPGFQKALSRLLAGEGEALVIYKLDRAFRSALDGLRVLKELDAANIVFSSVSETLSTDGAMGKMVLTMMLAFAQFERDLASERTGDTLRRMKRIEEPRDALEAWRKKKGLLAMGKAPYGYRWEGPHRKMRLVKDVQEMAVVNLVRQLREEERTYQEIEDELAAAGHATRKGTPFSARQLRRMVEGDFYAHTPGDHGLAGGSLRQGDSGGGEEGAGAEGLRDPQLGASRSGNHGDELGAG